MNNSRSSQVWRTTLDPSFEEKLIPIFFYGQGT